MQEFARCRLRPSRTVKRGVHNPDWMRPPPSCVFGNDESPMAIPTDDYIHGICFAWLS